MATGVVSNGSMLKGSWLQAKVGKHIQNLQVEDLPRRVNPIFLHDGALLRPHAAHLQ